MSSTAVAAAKSASTREKTAVPSALNVPVRNTSLTAATFNLTKSAVGAGTVFLPSVFMKMGLGVGTTLLLSGAVLCAASLHFLGRMAHHCETGDYFRLGRLAMGRRGEQAVSWSLLLFLVGGLIAYSYLIGKYFSTALTALNVLSTDSALATPANMTVLVGFTFVFMLSCMRDMSQLAKTSILGMGCMVYIAGIFAWEALVGKISPDVSYEALPTFPTTIAYTKFLFSSVGKIVFAFVNHFTIVSLVPVMVNPSAKSRGALIVASTGAALAIYSMAVYGAIFRFGGNLPGEALAVYTSNGAANPLPYTIAQLALGFVLICSYPLLCDPARSCFDALTFGSRSAVSPIFRHYLETAIFVAVPTVVAYSTGDAADDVMGLFSAICGSLLVFTFPGLFFIRLSRPYKYSMSKIERITAYVCIVLGVVLAALGAWASVETLMNKFMTKA